MKAEPIERTDTPERVSLEEAFARSERRIGQFLAQVVRSRTLAEDLLQETFVAAFRAREELDTVANPEAWLFGIARNRALHALRSRRRRFAAIARLAGEVGASPDPADAAAVRDLLARALEPAEATLLVLRYVHGFDAPELATMTGASPDAIRKRLSRARKRMLAALEEDPAATPDTSGRTP